MDRWVLFEPGKSNLPDDASHAESLLALWEEIDDDFFECYFRARFFGDQPISRIQALSILRENGNKFLTPISDPANFPIPREMGEISSDSPLPDFSLALDVIPREFPLGPMGSSILVHALGVLLIALGPILPQTQPGFKIETQQILYYRLSEGFPDISPLVSKSAAAPSSARSSQDKVRHRRDVSIHPGAKEVPLVIERARVQPLKQMPRLELPNIFLKQLEMANPLAPSKEQLFVEEMRKFASKSLAEPLPGQGDSLHAKPADLSRFFDFPGRMPSPLLKIPDAPAWLETPRHPMSQFQLPAISRSEIPLPTLKVPEAPNAQIPMPFSQLQISGPLQMGQTAPAPLMKIPEVPVMSSSVPMPQVQPSWQLQAGRDMPMPRLAVPDAPADSSVDPRRLDQVLVEAIRLRQEKPPAPAPQLAVPSGDLSESRLQSTDISGTAPSNLLVYSLNPGMPAPNLAVPKISSQGRIISSQEDKTENPGNNANASARSLNAMPDVHIRDSISIPPGSTNLPTVQGPALNPSLQRTEIATASIPSPAKSPPPALKLPEPNSSRIVPLSTFPLAKLEHQGVKVYTASIMAPNFSSRRGVWFFRFARLPDHRGQNPESRAFAGSEGIPDNDFGVTAPIALLQVDPRYPPEVVREKIEGIVILYAIILKDGTVDASSIRVLQKLDSRLDSYASDALRQWKFKPSRQNGEPIDIQAEITIPFYFRSMELARTR
jgi:TonB family protein